MLICNDTKRITANRRQKTPPRWSGDIHREENAAGQWASIVEAEGGRRKAEGGRRKAEDGKVETPSAHDATYVRAPLIDCGMPAEPVRPAGIAHDYAGLRPPRVFSTICLAADSIKTPADPRTEKVPETLRLFNPNQFVRGSVGKRRDAFRD